MRALLIAFPALLTAAPLAAQTAPPRADRQIPPELSDPAIADQLTRALVPLSKALMNLPIGELEAAMAGRAPTEADRRKRVRDEIGPEGERELAAHVAKAGPQMRAMQKALVASLPALMGALEGVEKELERATANLPDPTYPKR
ncbi:MAG: hypothetical protein M3Q19_16305 [Pseudomonadota bacterium]|nr:hypothetical protein [Pseudomonadota bacterium]